VITQKDPVTTGRFEVTIVPAEQLIYSRISRKQGKCETAEEREEILQQIENYMHRRPLE
jgi:hypothetical protein